MAQELEIGMGALVDRAAVTLEHLNFAKRAFVVEFAGTPKSGKSSSVETIRHFFSRSGYKVHVLAERAAMCPIPMKGHLFFNTWCLTAMLAELLENVEDEQDLIIVDRGLFDSLVWLTLQAKRGEVTEQEVRSISEFVLLERWRQLTDLVVLMNVSAEEALRRESSTRITQKTGSIMAEPVLRDISAAVNETATLYGSQFPSVFRVASGEKSHRETCVDIANEMLEALEEQLNPEIQVVPRDLVDGIPDLSDGNFNESQRAGIVESLSGAVTPMRRAEAEANPSVVQLVPCGVMVHEGRAFVFERTRDDEKSELYGRAVLWKGCHMERAACGENLLRSAEDAVHKRVAQDLFLSRKFASSFLGFAWDGSSDQSAKHLGLVFRLEITSEDVANSLRKKEYRQKRGHPLTASFQNFPEIQRGASDIRLEKWSRDILNHLMTEGD